MSKRQKKEQRRINMYFNNSNPQDLAIYSLISRAHSHSELPLSLGNFCKFFLGEFLLQMQAQAMAEEATSDEAREAEESDSDSETSDG